MHPVDFDHFGDGQARAGIFLQRQIECIAANAVEKQRPAVMAEIGIVEGIADGHKTGANVVALQIERIVDVKDNGLECGHRRLSQV